MHLQLTARLGLHLAHCCDLSLAMTVVTAQRGSVSVEEATYLRFGSTPGPHPTGDDPGLPPQRATGVRNVHHEGKLATKLGVEQIHYDPRVDPATR